MAASISSCALSQSFCPVKPIRERGALTQSRPQCMLVPRVASVPDCHCLWWRRFDRLNSASSSVVRVDKTFKVQGRAVRAALDTHPSKAGSKLKEAEGRDPRSRTLPRRSENLVEPDNGVKSCLQCQRSKLLGDFERSGSTADRRSDLCRACLAVFRAQNLEKELFHLSLSVEEAWRQGKACKACGHFKELRDYTVKSSKQDGVSLYCRSCESTRRSKIDKPPVDTPQRCNMCTELKAASEFYPDRSKASGLSYFCRPCRKLSNLIYRSKKKGAAEIPRVEKCCRACGVVKQASEFHKDRSSSDKLDFVCKPCRISKNKEWQRRRRLNDQS